MMEDVVVQNLTEPAKMLKECGTWCIKISV